MAGVATTRADTAAICVAAALAPGAANTTFELATDSKKPENPVSLTDEFFS